MWAGDCGGQVGGTERWWTGDCGGQVGGTER